MATGSEDRPGWFKAIRSSVIRHSGKIVVGIVLAFAVSKGCSAWDAHRLADRQYAESTQEALKNLNERNKKLDKQVAIHRQRAIKAEIAAAKLKAREDSILALHPIESAPAACTPWTVALTTCRARADSLTNANTELRAASDSLDSKARTLTEALARSDTALKRSLGLARKERWTGRTEGAIVGILAALLGGLFK